MSLPKYPRYRPSELKWLGEVPAHWPSRKLKYVARFSGGGTPDRANASFWGGDIPWVSPKDMKTERIEGSEESITEAGLLGSTSALIYPGQVLMVVRSGILKHTIPVAINHVEVAMNQDMKAISFDSQHCTSSFFLRWVQGLNDELLLEWAKQGVTVESIEHAYLAGTPLPLPPLEEQEVIAKFLDRETSKIDVLIAEQEKLLNLLAEKRQATISHAVTRGLNPDVPMKDSGVEWLGVIPKHWNVIRLAQLFHEISEPGEDALPILSVSIHDGVSDGELDEDEMERKVTRSDDRSKYKRVAPGDLVYNMMRAWQGGFGSVEVLGMVSPAYVVARPLGNDFITGYIEQLLRTAAGAQEAKRYSRGVTDFRLRLYWDEFKNICVPLPPKDEQVAIMHALDDSNARIDGLASEARAVISLLGERRAALISAAVTGKIDVREQSMVLATAA